MLLERLADPGRRSGSHGSTWGGLGLRRPTQAGLLSTLYSASFGLRSRQRPSCQLCTSRTMPVVTMPPRVQ
jgi:hypothetical protein